MRRIAFSLADVDPTALFVYFALDFIRLGFLVFQRSLAPEVATVLDILGSLAAQAVVFLGIAVVCLAVVTCLQRHQRRRAAVLALVVPLALLPYLAQYVFPPFGQVVGDTSGLMPQAFSEVFPGLVLFGLALMAAPHPGNAAEERGWGSLVCQQLRCQGECPHVLLHLLVIARPSIAGFAIGERALIALDAAVQPSNRLLAGHPS
ncbi:MAG TPA: hypothetical protein VGP82_22565 [Ktedonobacterales bacterium]|jgi:hypothetical protein|nr:hypothetical protein [Ktedonobacterales bacterium]